MTRLAALACTLLGHHWVSYHDTGHYTRMRAWCASVETTALLPTTRCLRCRANRMDTR